MIPQIALDYIKNKRLTPAFSYKDVWQEEHATGFTVAKAMQLDVLADLHKSVISAIEHGESFDTFKKSIKPTLMQKGWWGKKEMTDPLTGETVKAQLGSDRRLKTIYHVNMRSAYQKEQYEQAMKSELHPYLMYRIGPSVNHRKEHVSWDGLILPKTDPWWDAHLPPNGWGCRCYTRAVSEARFQKYKQRGIPVPPAADGTGGGTLKVKTEAPPVKYKTYFNERKGSFEQVPEGVDPAFNWNVGKTARNSGAKEALINAQENYNNAARIVPPLTSKASISAMQTESTKFFKTLTKDEHRHINVYSNGDGADLNALIHKLGKNWINSSEAAVIKTLDGVIEKAPPLASSTFFFKGDDAAHWTDWSVGNEKPVAGFFSTAVHKKIAESYATDKLYRGKKPIMVVIRAPEKTKGLYIGSETAYHGGNEYEFLFPRDTVFRVLEKSESYILLEVVR